MTTEIADVGEMSLDAEATFTPAASDKVKGEVAYARDRRGNDFDNDTIGRDILSGRWEDQDETKLEPISKSV